MKKIQFEYHETANLQEEDIQSTASTLSEYAIHLKNVVENSGYDADEASINLSFDAANLEKVKQLGERFKDGELKYIFVVGIGGSELGTKAVYHAIKGRMDYLRGGEFHVPKLVFVDTVSSNIIKEIESIIKDDHSLNHKDEMLIVLVTKSGTTIEPIANYEMLSQMFSGYFGSVADRTVVITKEGSPLWNSAVEREIERLDMPEKVGGRYSVFSSVGLFPLYLVGIDIEELLAGARDFVEETLLAKETPVGEQALARLRNESDISLTSAILTHLHHKKKKNINNSFFFDPRMEYIGKWYRQLMGESIGKKDDLAGKKVNTGITPIISIGTNDLHSMLQLYLGGPRDKFTSFVVVDDAANDTMVEKTSLSESMNRALSEINEPILGEIIPDLEGQTLDDIMEDIYEDVVHAYVKNKLPFAVVKLPVIDEYTIGQYLQFKMLEMMYLAKLMNVNAFDQPAVEEYKEDARGK